MKFLTSLVFQRLFPFIRRCVPASLEQSPSSEARAENLVTAAVIAAAVIPAYGFVYQFLGEHINAQRCFFATLSAVGALAIFGISGSIALARETLLITIFCLLLALTYRLGGINAPTVIWLAVCPLIATATGGRRHGLIWAALSLITIAGTYSLDVLGMFPQTALNDMRLLGAVSAIGFVIAVAIFLLISERINSDVIRKLDQALTTIHDLAIRDDLTGVFNRRELLRIAEQEKNRTLRQETQFCLCLIDLDYFKRINDTYGHAAGDQVLKEVASRIQEQIRKTDCFGRYGGEEFLLLLTETDAHAAKTFVDRIRESIGDAGFSELLDGRRITISIGVAQHQPQETIEQTLSRADNALYRAKHQGRNSVVIAADESQAP